MPARDPRATAHTMATEKRHHAADGDDELSELDEGRGEPQRQHEIRERQRAQRRMVRQRRKRRAPDLVRRPGGKVSREERLFDGRDAGQVVVDGVPPKVMNGPLDLPRRNGWTVSMSTSTSAPRPRSAGPSVTRTKPARSR